MQSFAVGSALLLVGVAACLLSQSTAKVKRTVIITGANRGIGLAAVKELATSGDWRIVVASRSVRRAEKAVSSLRVGRENVEIAPLDLADLSSVRNFAKTWGSQPIDCLALNAGIQCGSGKQPRSTAQDFEETIGVNHLGHFLLVNLLLKNVQKAPKGRVVFTGSGVHNPDEPGGNVGSRATLGDLAGFACGFKSSTGACMVDGGPFDPDKAYKDSKLCNVMTALELSQRINKTRTTVNVMNPGLIPTTGLFREFNPIFVAIFTFLTTKIFKVAATETEGGRRLAYLVESEEVNGINGKYFSGRPGSTSFSPIDVSVEANDQEKRKKLWNLSKTLVGI